MRENKSRRVLDIYSKLDCGESIYKSKEAKLFGVSYKSIERDIDEIDTYLLDQKDERKITYCKAKKEYSLEKGKNCLSKEDIFSLIKILLESRAFTKKDNERLVNSLLYKLNENDKKAVKELVGNELINYNSVRNNDLSLKKIWDIGEFILRQEVIEVTYKKMDLKEVKRFLNPVSIMFSEYYFYLIAYIDKGNYDFPIVYRLDRILSYKSTNGNFKLPNSQKEMFQDNEFRKRIQFMYAGKLMRIKFEYSASALDAILDRLPTAEKIGEKDGKHIITAEVFGTGIIMWILSQKSNIKVLEPKELRDEVKCEIEKMYELYI